MLFTLENLTPRERGVIERIDDLRQKLRYATQERKKWNGLLRRATFARAIQGSNSIEGYNASFEDAVAAVEDEDPLDASEEVWAAITGYRDAMTYVLQLADDPHFTYSEDLIRGLHYMMLHYDLSKNPGRWRPGVVYVRREPSGEIVYEGPDAEKVPALMHELVEALNQTDDIPVMARAAMAHLNLTMVHPFSDGNGRMARALQTLVLAREGILAPEFCSIEEYLGRHTQAYYDVLAEVGRGNWRPERDPKPWVRFCLRAHYRQASGLLRNVRDIGALWEELDREVSKRGLPERAVLALLEAAFGARVRNSSYRTAADISVNLASRDLKHLADLGLLVPKGERRGRSYSASDLIRRIRNRTKTKKVEDEDPFATEQRSLPGLESAH